MQQKKYNLRIFWKGTKEKNITKGTAKNYN